MCGIAGAAGEGADAAWLSRALDRLAARGPDGTGEWRSASGRAILGHRRLAILDTSPRGCQPSLGPDRASAFVHNGEIYNFRELRGRLEELGERFVSESDGEVVHRLLRRDGPEALSRLEGMFALALWNEDEGRLLLARDPIGIKPLYYARLPRGLAFASQPSALLSLPELAARLDPEPLADFLAYGYVPFDRCLFAGIRKLPAAHRLLYDAATRTIEITRYWRLERSSVRDMIGFVEKHTGTKLAIDRKPPAPGDAPTTWASVERAEKLLGWRPEVRLEEGVRRTVEWARKARAKHPAVYG